MTQTKTQRVANRISAVLTYAAAVLAVAFFAFGLTAGALVNFAGLTEANAVVSALFNCAVGSFVALVFLCAPVAVVNDLAR